jgi:hypothetical protein
MRRAFSQALASLNWRSSAVGVFWVGALAMTLLAMGLLCWLLLQLALDWVDVD